MTPDLQAELVYQAYRPINLSCQETADLLMQIDDVTHHLDKYTFPKNGYALELLARQEVELAE